MIVSFKHRKCILQYGACAVVIATVLFLARSHWHELQTVWQVRLRTVLWLSVFFVGSQIFAGLILKRLLAVFSIDLCFREWFGLICIRSMGNYLPLSAGVTANAAYLKIERDLPVSKFAGLMAGNLVLSALAGSFLGTVLLSWRYFVTGHVPGILLLLFVLVVAVALAAIFAPLSFVTIRGRVMDWLRSVHLGWEMIRSKKGLLISVVLLHFGALTLIALQYGLVLRDIGSDLDWSAIMVMAVAANIIRFASLFPGNIGVREAVAGSVTHAFGMPFSAGLLASTIGRVVSMFWILLLGTLFVFVFLHSKRAQSGPDMPSEKT